MTTPINQLSKIEPPRDPEGHHVIAPMAAVVLEDLVALNERIGESEQKYSNAETTEAARKEILEFFENHLSGKLIFRRTSGKVVGKSGQESFLDGLGKNPFSSRRSEEIAVAVLGDRALVTLIVVGTRADDQSVHRYRNIRLFSRSGANWILELWYNYEITGNMAPESLSR